MAGFGTPFSLGQSRILGVNPGSKLSSHGKSSKTDPCLCSPPKIHCSFVLGVYLFGNNLIWVLHKGCAHPFSWRISTSRGKNLVLHKPSSQTSICVMYTAGAKFNKYYSLAAWHNEPQSQVTQQSCEYRGGDKHRAESPKQNTVKENGSGKPRTENSTPRPFAHTQVLLATTDNTIWLITFSFSPRFPDDPSSVLC